VGYYTLQIIKCTDEYRHTKVDGPPLQQTYPLRGVCLLQKVLLAGRFAIVCQIQKIIVNKPLNFGYKTAFRAHRILIWLALQLVFRSKLSNLCIHKHFLYLAFLFGNPSVFQHSPSLSLRFATFRHRETPVSLPSFRLNFCRLCIFWCVPATSESATSKKTVPPAPLLRSSFCGEIVGYMYSAYLH
jgi:hypothetical protein